MSRFHPFKHLPTFSRMLFQAVFEPIAIFIVIAGNAVLAIGASLFFHFEHGANPGVKGMGDALWWGLATVTTVGYGDIVPHTPEGRVIGGFMMVLGIFFFVSFTATVATILTARATQEIEKETETEYRRVMKVLERIEKRLEKLEKH